MCPVQSSGERVPYVPGLHPQHCALVSPEAVGYFDFHLDYCGEYLSTDGQGNLDLTAERRVAVVVVGVAVVVAQSVNVDLM